MASSSQAHGREQRRSNQPKPMTRKLPNRNSEKSTASSSSLPNSSRDTPLVSTDVNVNTPPADIATERYTCVLPPGVPELLLELEKVDGGSLKSEDLGRAVRLSPVHRSKLHDALMHCTMMAMQHQSKADIAKKYLEIMQKIIRIQSYADPQSHDRPFPFMKLPLEVREMIYKLAMKKDEPIGVDACTTHMYNRVERGRSEKQPNLALMTLSRQCRAEVAPIYYEVNAFAFSCTCALSLFLKECPNWAWKNIQSVLLIWRGEQRVHSIRSLGRLPKLAYLGIGIHRDTTVVPSYREKMIREAFDSLSHKPLRTCDSLGFDELLMLRGLKKVWIEPSVDAKKNSRTKRELEHLQGLLEKKVLSSLGTQGLEIDPNPLACSEFRVGSLSYETFVLLRCA